MKPGDLHGCGRSAWVGTGESRLFGVFCSVLRKVKRPGKLLMTLAVIGIAVSVGVASTAHFGTRTVKRRAIADMNPPSGIEESDGAAHSAPYYYCTVQTYGPFLVRAEYGWQIGPLSGRGGSAMYIWFFGWTKRMAELETWDS